MRIVHLMASPFVGGPERQMLGLAGGLPADAESAYLSFAERGLATPFIEAVRSEGHEGKLLVHNFPHLSACVSEVGEELRRLGADILCCSGYKPDIVGWRAARRVGIPVVAVAHGWTGVSWKVRRYEWFDRVVLRWMDAVVCVSNEQAARVRRARVPDGKIVVIRNAVDEDAFIDPDPERRAGMEGWFGTRPRWLVASAGRLSPEKGFALFVDAAARVAKSRPGVGFVLFGEGPLRGELERQIAGLGLQDRFVLAGFRSDLRQWLPSVDVGVMSSYTEGLPVFLLEAAAAAVPVVATSVGGIPEVIADGETGYLVRAGDAAALADRMLALVDSPAERERFGQAARSRVRQEFSLPQMGQQYYELFSRLVSASRPA